MLWIRWQDRVRTGLPSISDLICQRQSSVFCHVARLPASTPAHQDLKLQVELSLNRFPSADWKRRSGHPHGRWVPTASGKSLSSRPMAFHQQERQFRSDATVLADCALTMTTTTRDTYELHKRSFLSMSEWPTRKLHQHSPTYFDVFYCFSALYSIFLLSVCSSTAEHVRLFRFKRLNKYLNKIN